ncbi:MAG: precorrin-6y C5,15-methyltransferase (decarboxylating) subunit CbiE [Hyphomicrobiaceae bacterium]|nr:precorrin-6y C5,15-methyltransferase (decarboxylating) subunit CbiE [Hyphomicrobiaceae bacterium]
MSAWLTVVGVGLEGVGGLPPSVRALLDTADVIVGRKRLLEGITAKSAETHAWSSPIDDTLAQIEGWKGRKVIVLATGNPMHFGVGVTLARRIPSDEITIIPAPSAFSLAAARLKWPLQGLETLSLHGRPVSALHPFVQPGARLLALTAGNETIHEVSALLVARGFGKSIMTVLENMGSADEHIIAMSADECEQHEFADFNTLAIECTAGPGARFLPRVPGLPDDAFNNDGQLTKRDIRAITLSALGPTPRALLWDVGAGCGSIAIEWMRTAPGARAIAFERDENRIRLIAENAVALGAPDLDIVSGDVADSLGGHPAPSAIFLGGAVTSDAVFVTCWNALVAGGRFVANSVTLEGDAALIARHEAHGGELVRIEVSHVGPVGARRVMRPRMSVLQWRTVKGQ